jgi:hypothetical protein
LIPIWLDAKSWRGYEPRRNFIREDISMAFLRSITAAIMLAACPTITLAADKNGDDDKPVKY